MNREVSHYVVTAHPPGGVLHTVKCNFLSKDSEDVVIGKSRCLEVRQLRNTMGNEEPSSSTSNASPFPIVLSAPINGRITSLVAFQLDSKPTSLLFLTTDQHQYAVIGYNPNNPPHYIQTYASGSLTDSWNMLGSLSEGGPLIAVDPHSRCLVLHLYDGLISVFPILSGRDNNTILGAVWHGRLEERTVLAMTLLHHLDPENTPPHLCLLHQDSRGAQHVTTHVIDLRRTQLMSQAAAIGQLSSSNPNELSQLEWLKKSRIDGGSSMLIPVPARHAAAAAAAAASSTSTNPNNSSSNNSAPAKSPSGGVVVLGQRQITFCALNHYKVMPIPPALILSWDALPPDISGMPRYLLGDEFGNLHMLTLITQDIKVVALQLDTLGSCTLSSCLQYLDHGLVFCGSTLGDSQLVQIHDEPIPVDEEEMDEGDAALELGDTTYLSVVEEYTHLGPIVDFDLVPMAGTGSKNNPTNNYGQSQVVTASGSSKSGSLRLIRNGIGMKEYASVELSGIQNMWSLRANYEDVQDAYLVQSFVSETRVLGVVSAEQPKDAESMDTGEGKDTDVNMDGDEEIGSEVGGTLEEVFLPGLEPNKSTLYVGNVVGNFYLQITDTEIRLMTPDGNVVDAFGPDANITVASGNEAGQIVVALQGGKVLYVEAQNSNLVHRSSKQMDREVSCLNINPFKPKDDAEAMDDSSSNEKTTDAKRNSFRATLCAVGLWDDFTVRLLSLESLELHEMLSIHLSTEDEDADAGDGISQGQRRSRNNMMARSLCLITLDFSSSAGSGTATSHTGNTAASTNSGSPGVDMLLVGLGDGTVVSFAVILDDRVRVQSRKEVSLGTQRVNLVPLNNERGGSCVLATGDRPTVIYLAGMGGTSGKANYNPKLCYSNVNLSPVDEGDADVSKPHSQESVIFNVAAPFSSLLLFDDMGNEHYSLCIADDENLRLGIIDDIQKLHVTTCRLGMAPRRVVHCPEGRLFAVGCIESGIRELGVDGGDMTMGNCIRFLDDTTFEDIHRIDMEPTEMVLTMMSVTLKLDQPVRSATASSGDMGVTEPEAKSYLVVGTAYALPDEDEPTRGRILVYSCNPEDGAGTTSRSPKQMTELQVRGGAYSICQFFNGTMLVTVNSKTQLCKLINDGTGIVKLSIVGTGHHGHILSLLVASRAPKMLKPSPSAGSTSINGREEAEGNKKPESDQKEMLAIVGDLMRSISLVQYYPQYETLEEVARDFNANWTTAVSMLTDDVYIGAENWNNLYVLRRNVKAQNEEVRCRLDTVGEFHLGEMCNKFMSGSLVMPNNASDKSKSKSSQSLRRAIASPKKKAQTKGSAATRSRKPVVAVGSQTLFGTVDGTLGVVLGLDAATAAFFSCLETSMEKVIMPIGNFNHQQFRSFSAEKRQHPSHGFVDGDLVESFLDLDKGTMELVVKQMNKDGTWDTANSSYTGSGKATDDDDDGNRWELSVDDVLAVVEEMTMLH